MSQEETSFGEDYEQPAFSSSPSETVRRSDRKRKAVCYSQLTRINKKKKDMAPPGRQKGFAPSNVLERSPAKEQGGSYIEVDDEESDTTPTQKTPGAAGGMSIADTLALLVAQGQRIEKKFDNVEARLDRNAGEIRGLNKKLQDTNSPYQ